MTLNEKYKSLLNTYHVNTPLRIAHFMAQIEAESGLKPISENLNYSGDGLFRTFHKYFPNLESTVNYKRNPQKIANKVYADRGGNGNEASGDGWKYRGRGFIQITLKGNYVVLSKDTRIDFVNNPDLLLQEANSMIAALWYWNKNKLNDFADKDNLDAISDVINIGRITPKYGDANGFGHRKELLEKYKKQLGI